MRKPATVFLCLIALIFYVASLSQPAFTCAHSKSFPGYTVLMIGFMGFLALDPRWLGNITFVLLLFASLKAVPINRPVIIFSTAALALASFAQAAGCEGGGGAPGVSTGLAIGGYLWVAALLISCAANLSVVMQKSETVSPLGFSEAISAAIAQYRLHQPVTHTCPDCFSVISIGPIQGKSNERTMRINSSCACGGCSGTYDINRGG